MSIFSKIKYNIINKNKYEYIKDMISDLNDDEYRSYMYSMLEYQKDFSNLGRMVYSDGESLLNHVLLMKHHGIHVYYGENYNLYSQYHLNTNYTDDNPMVAICPDILCHNHKLNYFIYMKKNYNMAPSENPITIRLSFTEPFIINHSQEKSYKWDINKNDIDYLYSILNAQSFESNMTNWEEMIWTFNNYTSGISKIYKMSDKRRPKYILPIDLSIPDYYSLLK